MYWEPVQELQSQDDDDVWYLQISLFFFQEWWQSTSIYNNFNRSLKKACTRKSDFFLFKEEN